MDEDQIVRWMHLVLYRSDDIDPDEERDWYDMAVGFFLGVGMSGDEAYAYADELLRRGLL